MPLSSPFSLLLSFLSRFSLFHLGRMARRLKIQRPFLARSQNSTTFFSFVERTPLPRERPVFLAKLFLSRLPATFLEEGGGEGGGEDRGG